MGLSGCKLGLMCQEGLEDLFHSQSCSSRIGGIRSVCSRSVCAWNDWIGLKSCSGFHFRGRSAGGRWRRSHNYSPHRCRRRRSISVGVIVAFVGRQHRGRLRKRRRRKRRLPVHRARTTRANGCVCCGRQCHGSSIAIIITSWTANHFKWMMKIAIAHDGKLVS